MREAGRVEREVCACVCVRGQFFVFQYCYWQMLCERVKRSEFIFYGEVLYKMYLLLLYKVNKWKEAEEQIRSTRGKLSFCQGFFLSLLIRNLKQAQFLFGRTRLSRSSPVKMVQDWRPVRCCLEVSTSFFKIITAWVHENKQKYNGKKTTIIIHIIHCTLKFSFRSNQIGRSDKTKDWLHVWLVFVSDGDPVLDAVSAAFCPVYIYFIDVFWSDAILLLSQHCPSGVQPLWSKVIGKTSTRNMGKNSKGFGE